MSSQQHQAAAVKDDANRMDIDLAAQPLTPPGLPAANQDRPRLAILLKDVPGWLTKLRAMRETDVIILLTPVVIPISRDPTDISDPFEPLGRALAKSHARIRQVPYTQRNGITSTHLGFIKRGHVIILCFAVSPGHPIRIEFADIAFAASDNKPCIIVVCCSPVDTQHATPFPTIIQTTGYSPSALEAAAALILGEQLHQSQIGSLPETSTTSLQQPRLWPVEQWNETRDISHVLKLWAECVGERFAMDQQTLASLLRRPGYAKHYVVRDSGNGEILGFCATYLSYVDKEGERLIASVAILIVRSTSRQRGIGLSLHSHAIGQLKRTRGVIRLQLGSTFPRILYGPPLDMPLNEEWFRRRGWQLNRDVPGQGQAVYDLILSFTDWQYTKDPQLSVSPIFRLCTQADMGRVLEIAEKASSEQTKMGWFDQYSSLMNGPNVKDVVLGIVDNVIVATALTYTPSCGSQIAANLPWAGRISNDVGGVSCICIGPNKRDMMMMGGLLDTCVATLQDQGMKKMFIDGISEGVGSLIRLGFREWAQYRDVWKDT